MKVATFAVHASKDQAGRWKRASDAEGCSTVGNWLAAAADSYLQMVARAGRPLPLVWRRYGYFKVHLMDGTEVEVRGVVSPPFGIFQGSAFGPNENNERTLVYLPTRRIVATLARSRHCRALAAEIAPALIKGELPDPAPIVERHVRDAK